MQKLAQGEPDVLEEFVKKYGRNQKDGDVTPQLCFFNL